ncbi:tetratricopeptide repeat protein 16 isoform X3 [Fukomys damarensis]|uniref:tetratricopeptide repeat protein 16 isoform X3 n=1 Tax=Fukomys damarensis TaxID=885580 RepID=UPI00054025D3|nr:tetratricopeptide repeat protein 16 isoform X3 [Fukomys damarensis]
MTDSREAQAEEAKAKVEGRDDLELGQTSSYSTPKPWVIPVPRGTLHSIFGTSQVFRGIDDVKPKVTGLTVPLKVREYYHRGQGCLEQEDWETAVLFFSRALHLDPQMLCDFSSAAQNLRRAYLAQPENRKHLERLTFVLYLQGQCLYEQCNFEDALMVFSQALELQPEKHCFWYRSMACLLALQRHHDCLVLITKQLKQGTTNADLYILRARIYNLFQMPNFCYRDLCSALLLDPKHPQARVLLQMMVDQAQEARRDAGILAIQGRLQHTLQRINCAIDNSPLDPSLFLFRGIVYRRLQEFDAAVEDFLKILDMATDSQCDTVRQAQRQLLLTYNDFAVHCYKQGSYQEGVLLLNKALRGEQREKGLYINRGDCFFQLGNLTFAEADYNQALALSPQDQGANTRMSVLQEMMGLGEQKCRQFQRAEDHFSAAIQHNPLRAQCYLYRARNRQILQDIFGARQDVATVLLLNPKQPKHREEPSRTLQGRAPAFCHLLRPTSGSGPPLSWQLSLLLTKLFPGMSVEEVLSSQVGQLAKLQLERMVERGLQAKSPQGIVGVRDLECQKAQALKLSWKLKWPLSETPKEPELTSQMLQVSLEDSGEDTEALKGKKAGREKEDKLKLNLHKVTSTSDSDLDQTSSGSVLGCKSLVSFRTASTSGTEMSTPSQEYRSTSTTPGMVSDSSLPKSQSSDSRNEREAQSLKHRPRKPQASQAQMQSSPKTTQSQGSSETKAAKSQRQRPSKIKATQSPRQRFRKAKATHGQNWGQVQGSSRTKSKGFHDPSGSLNNTKANQGQSWMPNETEAALNPEKGTSSSSNKTDATKGLGQNISKSKAGQGPDHHAVL